MEDKLSKGGNYKRFKKGSKREHGNSGPENFVHPSFKISGSAPAPYFYIGGIVAIPSYLSKMAATMVGPI